ncbi:hypothetical protein PMAYCL1PPCAC_22037, partial [Pristionchus mayeri]
RACAVFYRRARRTKRKLRCKSSGDCISNGRLFDCRRCRFDRINAVLENAKERAPRTEGSAPVKEPERVAAPTSKNDISTPVLERLRRAYTSMSRLRLLSELSMRPLDQAEHPSVIDTYNYSYITATHGLTFRTRRVLLSALYEFASIAVPDFTVLTGDQKWRLVSGSCEMINTLESTYRSTRIYPNDQTIFISYTTIVCPQTLDYYLSDCPLIVNVEDGIKELKKNLDENVVTCKREWKRVDPSEEEFLIMLALAFWDAHTRSGDECLSRLATESRAAIMQDLHSHYANSVVTDYATRIEQLFCLLVDNERSPKITRYLD